MCKKWPVAMVLMLIGVLAMTPLSTAKETRQLLIPNEETDLKPMPQGGFGSGLSETLKPWEIEGDTSNDYEYPLEPNSTQTSPSFTPNGSDNDWLDGDTNNPRQRSGTVPFIRF